MYVHGYQTRPRKGVAVRRCAARDVGQRDGAGKWKQLVRRWNKKGGRRGRREDEERVWAPGGLERRIDERERTERNFAFNQPSNETARLVGSRASEEKRRGVKRRKR